MATVKALVVWWGWAGWWDRWGWGWGWGVIYNASLSITDSATATIDWDSYDEYYLTSISNNTTISISGTPMVWQTIFIWLKDSGTSKTLTRTSITWLWVTLPTTTVAWKQHIIWLKYVGSLWRAIAVSVEI